MVLFKFHSALIDDDLVYVSRKKLEKEKNSQINKPEGIVSISMIDKNIRKETFLYN